MQPVDVIILIIIFFPAIAGLLSGFLNILSSVLSCAWALGISIALVPTLLPLFESSASNPALSKTLVFSGLLVINLIILNAASFFIIALLGKKTLTTASRLFGLFFGIVLGAILVEIMIFLGGFTVLPQESWWGDSKVIEIFEKVAVFLVQYLPEKIIEYHGYK